MTIHFICRGNSFRSFIAETYLRSLNLPNVKVISSGTVAAQYKELNKEPHEIVLQVLNHHGLSKFAKPNYADQLTDELLAAGDVTICMNDLVLSEASKFNLPADTIVWDISDIGEKERKPSATKTRTQLKEEAYQEITQKVDELVANLGLQG